MKAMPTAPWTPTYTITPAIARGLMTIEAAKAVVSEIPIPPTVEAELRRRARIRSTHYSTRIEGNRLTLAEAEQVIEGRQAEFHGRERDVGEVQNYWNALLRVEEWAAKKLILTEDLIQRLHALVERGSRAKPTPYRDGQNVIRDSSTGWIVFLPPEARDVTALMAQMVTWAKQAEKDGLPVPLIAALVHYQFVTIHPYYDGNGRTARLIATFLLHRGGYGLNGFFSLEEHHARDLNEYYQALVTHPHHNYYEGRAEADLTGWVEYFIRLTSRVFELAKDEALRCAREGIPTEPEELRKLDRRARIILGLFAKQETITAADVAKLLGLSDRQVRDLIRGWVMDGWLVVADPAKRSRAYVLSAEYRRSIGGLTAESETADS
jgi:Fic family protein